jgi:hypothetical protein
MKLPCDYCKAIRRFFGEPPRCELCGWEARVRASEDGAAFADASDARNARDTNSLSGADRLAADPAATSTTVWTAEHKIGLGALLKLATGAIVLVAAIYLVMQLLAPAKAPRFLVQSKYAIALKYNLLEDDVFMDPKPAGCEFTDAPVGDKHCHYEQDLNIVRNCLEAKCPVKRVYVSWHKVRD